MIPRAYITQWRSISPWIFDHQVEQDLVITRALIDLYNDEFISSKLLFRGGTALNKIFLNEVARYSEDIDCVQISSEPIGPIIDAIRETLKSWLGEPKRKISKGMVTLTYRFNSEPPDPVPLKLKIEINTREHFQLYGIHSYPLLMESRWYSGQSAVKTYCIEELMATKLRALYQRKKGRDLFDFYIVFKQLPSIDIDKIIYGFKKYVEQQGLSISKKPFLVNLKNKLQDDSFLNDIHPFLPTTYNMEYDAKEFSQNLIETIIDKL